MNAKLAFSNHSPLPIDPKKFSMTFIRFVDTDSVGDVVSQLQQASHPASDLTDINSLNTSKSEHGSPMLVLMQPAANTPPITSHSKESQTKTPRNRRQASWLINSAKLELTTPSDVAISLSHNECCILRAAANMNGQLLSRKTLIEAMGHKFLHYDERRLEALISRLRRKLTPYTSKTSPIRCVKGRGYLFGVMLQIVAMPVF